MNKIADLKENVQQDMQDEQKEQTSEILEGITNSKKEMKVNIEHQDDSDLKTVDEKESPKLNAELNLEHNAKNQADTKLEEVSQKQNQANLREIERKMYEIEMKTKEDISNVQTLLNVGFLSPLQAKSLVQLIMKKGNDRLLQCGISEPKNSISDASENLFDKKRAIIEFENENPDFFNEKGRLDVLNYVKSGSLEFDKNELVQISKLIEAVEAAAVARYLKQQEYDAKVTKTNEIAKSRLTSNAQNAKEIPSSQSLFTREQIGKMSGAEFTKNEKLIMEQLKKGLIR